MITPYYDHDGITLYHGDCMDILPQLDKADHIITDPPYDAKTHKGAKAAERPNQRDIDFDPIDPHVITPMLLAHVKRWCLCFCSMEMLGAYQAAAGASYIRGGFYHRLNGSPQFTGDRPAMAGEGIAILHPPGKKRWNRHGLPAYWQGTRVQYANHPTTKPLSLMMALINDFTDPGDLIFDPFAGSGTTFEACKKLRRKCVGIEISKKYCDVIVRRLKQEMLPL